MSDIRTIPVPAFVDPPVVARGNVISLEKRAMPSDQPAPVDLLGAFPVPDLPAGLLPERIERFAQIVGRQMGADPAGVAMSALLACAASIPDRVALQVKLNDPHWCVSARLWVLLVGVPSTKKSPIIKSATRPLYTLDRNAFDAWQAELAAYNATPKEDRVGPPPPACRLLIEDATMESAQSVLMGSPDGITLIDDEMSGFFGRIEKYAGKGGGADRAFWLKSFDGGPYMVNRITRTGAGGAIIPNISVSMLGGIQPQAIREIAASATDDGLIQRFFPVILKSAGIGHDEPVPDVVAEHTSLINALHHLDTDAPLQFDEEARAIRNAEEAKNNRLQVFEEINTKLASHIGKYDGLFARLCLIWHCIDHVDAVALPTHVTANTAQRVADFLHQFLLPHALSFYADVLAEGSHQNQLVEVAKHILAHRLDTVTNAELQSSVHVTRNLSKQGRIGLLEMLEGLGWATEMPGKGFKRSERWQVNPQVHSLYKDHATQARARKKQLRALMDQDFANRRTAKGGGGSDGF